MRIHGAVYNEETPTDITMISMASPRQKWFGFFLILVGLSSVFLCGGDATAALLMLPAGIKMIVSKQDLFAMPMEEGDP